MAIDPIASLQSATRVTRALFAPLPFDRNAELAPEIREALLGGLEKLLAHVKPEIIHPERIPLDGAALLVGNHALMGIDSFALLPLIVRLTGRLPRGLAEKVLLRIPLFERAALRCGAVEGTHENGLQLLRDGELVLVYPGGAPESFKAPQDHYKLFWQRRKGFIKLAMRAQAPIIPVMGAGVDHAYRYLFRDRWLVRHFIGQGKQRYDFPVSLGLGILPLPGKFTFHVGEPLHPPLGADSADDPVKVDAFHALVWQAAQAQLDEAMLQWRADGNGTV